MCIQHLLPLVQVMVWWQKCGNPFCRYWLIHPSTCNGLLELASQIAKFMGPTWDPPGSCRPQTGPMLATWTLLSGLFMCMISCDSSLILTQKKSSCIISIRADSRLAPSQWETSLQSNAVSHWLGPAEMSHTNSSLSDPEAKSLVLHKSAITHMCHQWSIFARTPGP